MGIGTTEIIIICGVIVLLFGAGAIPKLARSLGKARNEFDKGLKEGGEHSDESTTETQKDSSKRQ